jgi:hypothetical protein
VSLGDRGIATSDQEKTMAAGAQMWQSEMFTEDQMVAWENRTSATQTWAALQTYFTEKWLEWKQYSVTPAKQFQFKEAALQVQEAAAAKEEGKTQAMLSAGPTHKTDRPEGGDEQGQYGGHDEKNECPRRIQRHQENAPTGQGERQTPRQQRSSEEAQEEKDAMPQL